MALTPTLSAFDLASIPGDGLSVFFFDADYEFFPAGIGSSLGYTNYTGPLGFNDPSDELTTINGVQGAYVGVGFDVKGNFANTTDGKIGKVYSTTGTAPYYGTVNTTAVSGTSANTITIRGGQTDLYKVLSTTENLSTFPLANNEKYKLSPPFTLHQTVTSRDDIIFHKIRVSLENDSQRVRVDIQNPSDGSFYPYQVLDLNTLSLSGLSAGPPDKLRVGLAFATSDSFTNCEIKNLAIYGRSTEYAVKDTAKLRPLTITAMTVAASD